jgi:hypothetical protein
MKSIAYGEDEECRLRRRRRMSPTAKKMLKIARQAREDKEDAFAIHGSG